MAARPRLRAPGPSAESDEGPLPSRNERRSRATAAPAPGRRHERFSSADLSDTDIDDRPPNMRSMGRQWSSLDAMDRRRSEAVARAAPAPPSPEPPPPARRERYRAPGVPVPVCDEALYYFQFVNMVHSPRLPVLVSDEEIAMFGDANGRDMQALSRLLSNAPHTEEQVVAEDRDTWRLQRGLLKMREDPTHFHALSHLAANQLLPAALLQPLVQVCGVIHRTREAEGLRSLELFRDLMRPPCVSVLVTWVKAVLRADVFMHNAWSTRHEEIVVNDLVAGRCMAFFRGLQ